MRAITAVVGLLLGSLAVAGPAVAQEVRGRIIADTRIFPASPAYTDQRDVRLSPSIAIAPEFAWESGSGSLRLTLHPYLRLDAHDSDRTHADVREAGLLYLADGWTLFAGAGKVYWGRTESRHLVDVVNQTDGVEDIDGEDKLGQPMLNFTLERSWGAIDLFFLPYFRERSFAGERARLRGPLPVLDEPRYESEAGRWHPDLAARWSWFSGDWDLGVSAFRGTSRDPTFDLEEGGLRARYAIINQVSIDGQWTRGPTLWKFEATSVGGHGDRLFAAVLGLEHTFFGVGPGAADLGLVGELLLDDREPEAPYTPFDRDVFVGARWAFNDASATTILAGPIVDVRSGETLLLLEAERRLSDRWLVEVDLRIFAATDDDDPLHGLRRDDFVNLRVSRYF